MLQNKEGHSSNNLFILFAFFAITIGIYPFLYFFMNNQFGFLPSKDPNLVVSAQWRLLFFMHIGFGGLALLSGWSQFNQNWRNKHLTFHRGLGKLYIISVIFGGTAGMGLSFFANGGWISGWGFFLLAIVWLFTTIKAYTAIINRKVNNHEYWMIYSYAACFAAVMLRVWLPVLTIAMGNFINAYRVTAWLSWIPNLCVAYYILKSKKITLE